LGRILVPQSLRTHGAIRKNVVIIGINKKIEIWSDEAWAEVAKKAAADVQTKPKIASRFGL